MQPSPSLTVVLMKTTDESVRSKQLINQETYDYEMRLRTFVNIGVHFCTDAFEVGLFEQEVLKPNLYKKFRPSNPSSARTSI
ncbi:MAG: hypothetical protein LH679_04560 [Cyanobacteria bacterium CAN_BIN43]|nr:hypothetical protein [Cyanobacteria bacterium CAN_BIN43]